MRRAPSRGCGRLLAPAMGMDPAAVDSAPSTGSAFGVLPVTAADIARQQDIADTFAGLHLIPQKIDLRRHGPSRS